MTSMTHHETDDESMVVEVDSTVGEDEVTFNQAPVQLQKTTSKESFKIPSSRVMHRSYAEYDVSTNSTLNWIVVYYLTSIKSVSHCPNSLSYSHFFPLKLSSKLHLGAVLEKF